MPSPRARAPEDLVSEVQQARPELAGASVATVVRVALAYLAGRTLAAAIERGREPVKPGPKPKLITDD